MKKIIIILLLVSGFIIACSSGANLSKDEKMKLDPSLQKLLNDKEVPDKQYNVMIKEDGTKTYGVIIRSDKPADLETAGIFINSVSGDIITCKLTIQEIRKVAAIPSVSSISNSSKSYSK